MGIASITWGFAVDWFAAQLGVEHVLATELGENGHIEHVWPEDKPAWMERLALRLQVQSENVAAVGDSFGDVAMLQAASLAFLRRITSTARNKIPSPAGCQRSDFG